MTIAGDTTDSIDVHDDLTDNNGTVTIGVQQLQFSDGTSINLGLSSSPQFTWVGAPNASLSGSNFGAIIHSRWRIRICSRRRHRHPRVLGEVHRAAAGRPIGRRRVALVAVARALAVPIGGADRYRCAAGSRSLCRVIRAVWQSDAKDTGTNRDDQVGRAFRRLG